MKLAEMFWACLVIASCGGETNEGGKSSGGGSAGSAGSTAGGSGGSAGSTGGAGAVGSVSCGSFSTPELECAPEEYCCSGSCVANDLPCTGYAFHCDDAGDCPAGVCCVDKLSTLDGGLQVAECRATCDPDTQLIVCHAPADGCPSGMTCQITATLPPEYGYCCPEGQPCSAT